MLDLRGRLRDRQTGNSRFQDLFGFDGRLAYVQELKIAFVRIDRDAFIDVSNRETKIPDIDAVAVDDQIADRQPTHRGRMIQHNMERDAVDHIDPQPNPLERTLVDESIRAQTAALVGDDRAEISANIPNCR